MEERTEKVICRETYLGKKLHSFDDQPAYDSDCVKRWYKHGKLHRDGDKPAYIRRGSKKWYKKGKLHREGDEPAVLYESGAKEWYQRGHLHRDGDQPAFIDSNICSYFRHGKLHRERKEGGFLLPVTVISSSSPSAHPNRYYLSGVEVFNDGTLMPQDVIESRRISYPFYSPFNISDYNLIDVAEINQNKIRILTSVLPIKIFEDNCSVCTEPFCLQEPISTTKCNHNFHTKCIKEAWEKSGDRCPLCRTNLEF